MSGELTPQPHGGAILNGSKPGHPTTGRPPSAIRGSLRQILDDSLDVLRQIAMGEAALHEKCPECGYKGDAIRIRAADITKAIDVAGKYGLGERSKGYDEDLVDELSEAVGAAVEGRADADELLALVRHRWVAILAARVRGS